MHRLTDLQRKWLKRIHNEPQLNSTNPASMLTIVFLIKHGLAKLNRRDGKIYITPYGERCLDNKPKKEERRLERSSGGIYYWAYGSNLNVWAMRHRCPGAKKVCALAIDDGALVFRGVADAIHREGATVYGGLWTVTKLDEAALDAYEGIGSGLYNKCYMRLKVDGEEVRCMYYQMNVEGRPGLNGFDPPSEGYLNCIAEGYRDFGLPLEALDAALQEAWSKKRLTTLLRERRIKRGGSLAKVGSVMGEEK